MTFATKHEIGEMVWVLSDSKLSKRKISEVAIVLADVGPPLINYYFKVEGDTSSRFVSAPESRVAKDKNTILQRLLIDSED